MPCIAGNPNCEGKYKLTCRCRQCKNNYCRCGKCGTIVPGSILCDCHNSKVYKNESDFNFLSVPKKIEAA